MLYNKVKNLFCVLWVFVFGATAYANTNVILLNPSPFQDNVILPVTLMWSLQGNTSGLSLIRVEVYKTNEQMVPLGPPVWAANLFNVRQSQVLVDYREWVACGKYAWKVTLYRNAIRRTAGEYYVNNKRYTQVKTTIPGNFKIHCLINETEPVESAGYFDFPSDATPHVFSQEWGADIKFHYFSPYENDQIECKIYDWARNEIAVRIFPLKKGSNYLNWTGLFEALSQQVDASEVLFLEVVNGKDLKKTLKFNWTND